MFSGIIENRSVLERLDQGKLAVRNPWPLQEIHLGQSIAIDGCCLTVVRFDQNEIEFDVSPETVDRTTFSFRKKGDALNLERGLKFGDALDGHIVSGHIDGKAKVRSIEKLDEAGSVRVWFDVDTKYLKWLVEKGSVALDGVSLTVNGVDEKGFNVVLIPHTLKVTSLGDRKEGDRVNVEFDLLAKYLERLVPGRRAATAA